MTRPHSAWFKVRRRASGGRATRLDLLWIARALQPHPRKEARDFHDPGDLRRLEEAEAGRCLMAPPLGQVPHLSPESSALPIDTCTRIAAGAEWRARYDGPAAGIPEPEVRMHGCPQRAGAGGHARQAGRTLARDAVATVPNTRTTAVALPAVAWRLAGRTSLTCQ